MDKYIIIETQGHLYENHHTGICYVSPRKLEQKTCDQCGDQDRYYGFFTNQQEMRDELVRRFAGPPDPEQHSERRLEDLHEAMDTVDSMYLFNMLEPNPS